MAGARLVSLAAGVLQTFPPDEIVRASAAAGFNACGIWCDAQRWTPAVTRAVRGALADTGLVPLDLEVIWLHPDEAADTHDAVIDIALEVGARNILCVSSEPDDSRTAARLAHLCERAATGDTPARVVLEFLPITEVRSLQQARAIVDQVAHPLVGLLVDSLHLQRTGATPADLAQVPPHLMPYLQLCDAPLAAPGEDFDSLMDEALYGRCNPGEGELPLAATLSAVAPGLPLSLEIRSRALNEQHPDDANARAAAVMAGMRNFTAILEHGGA